MKKWWLRFMMVVVGAVLWVPQLLAQCSICAKTASQMGKESAEGLNAGIVYLMLAPFLVAGYIGYRWWKQEKTPNTE